MNTEDIFDIDAPKKNARKRLDKWLARERLYLSPAQRDKAALKLARVFANDDSDNPVLYQNFLTMIADEEEEGSDDINQIQTELKHIINSATPKSRIYFLSALFIFIFGALLFSMIYQEKIVFVEGSNIGTITSAQEQNLKSLVSEIVEIEQNNGHEISHAEIWKLIKDKFSISSYRDMNINDYEEGYKILEQRLVQANK